MRHPIEECNLKQQEALANLPEEKREWMARMFRIGNATYCYYHQSNDLSVFDRSSPQSPPAVDLLEWLEQQLNPATESRSARKLLEIYWEEYLEGLPNDEIRRSLRSIRLDQFKNALPFQRYVLERYDLGMDEFLRQNLSAEDYAFHQAAGERS